MVFENPLGDLASITVHQNVAYHVTLGLRALAKAGEILACCANFLFLGAGRSWAVLNPGLPVRLGPQVAINKNHARFSRTCKGCWTRSSACDSQEFFGGQLCGVDFGIKYKSIHLHAKTASRLF